jgi:hypothetical protein
VLQSGSSIYWLETGILAGSHSSSKKYSPRVMGEGKIKSLFLSDEWEPENYDEGLKYSIEQEWVKQGAHR